MTISCPVATLVRLTRPSSTPTCVDPGRASINQSVERTAATPVAVSTSKCAAPLSELTAATAFLEAILANIPAGVIVVDRNLKVEMWSSRAQDLWGARADEVEGRNLLTLDIGLPVERLRECIDACLTTRSALEELTLDAVNRRGKAIRCKISCTPLEGPAGDIREVILFTEEVGEVASSRAGMSAMEEDLAPKSSQPSER